MVFGNMTTVTQGHQVKRGIRPTHRAVDDVMHIQNWVFLFTFAQLTGMIVSKKDIFPCVEKTKLSPLLIRRTGSAGILHQLGIKRSRFYHYFCNWQDVMHLIYPVLMTGDFMLNGRG